MQRVCSVFLSLPDRAHQLFERQVNELVHTAWIYKNEKENEVDASFRVLQTGYMMKDRT